MNAIITRIDEWKRGSNGLLFKRIYFATADGAWAKTDVVKDYANFKKWQSLLEENIEIGGLRYANESKTTIDADSSPFFVRRVSKPQDPPQQMGLFT